jgi:hypothetical protein
MNIADVKRSAFAMPFPPFPSEPPALVISGEHILADRTLGMGGVIHGDWV